MYVSYEFYVQTFGGSIPEADFPKSEAEAEAFISYLTFVNGDIFAEEDDCVKKAVCAAADVIYRLKFQSSAAGTSPGSVKSVNNDGYAITFSTEKSDGQTTEAFLVKKVSDAVRVYLLPTGWLSRCLR